MDYIAVYRREDDPELAGVPVAFFRDGALLGDWHRVTNGVFDREPSTGSATLPDGAVTNESVAEHYASTGETEAPSATSAAYQQAVADAKMRIQQEALMASAERTARRQLREEGLMPDAGLMPADDEAEEAPTPPAAEPRPTPPTPDLTPEYRPSEPEPARSAPLAPLSEPTRLEETTPGAIASEPGREEERR